MKKRPVQKSYGYDSLQAGQVLSSFHFRHRCLHICKAGRDRSSERWNYLSRRLSCNLPL